ncbi:BrnA antitoxin family protein [Rhodospira trueperi]|uniref:Uncharacterized conserved protein, DUF4415 family n=1 Tax=Rhodospira trueperi TaxID=69960 RepID=A0A1G7DV17_9PROT|nr:BrnA antitoxin family protein [Rhodospira trueperi]SDE55313.1 Uncharacterized conserved protein, DUF4415 family [Rhodospira trueperi]
MSKIDDPDNPEWTEADFARSKPASALPEAVRAAFPKTGATATHADTAADKVPVSLDLRVDVVRHFQAQGPGWRERIDETLKALIR